jgi:hypothetical protein
MLLDIGGAVPGLSTVGWGGGAKYTGFVLAEDEDNLPPDWEPLSVEQGFPRGSNIVTAHTIDAAKMVWDSFRSSSEAELVTKLTSIAEDMCSTLPRGVVCNNPKQAGGWLLESPINIKTASSFGWSKQKVKTFLWEQMKVTPSDITKYKLEATAKACGVAPGESLPRVASPANIKIVSCAGPLYASHSYWLKQGFSGCVPTNAEIKLPAKAKWDALLKQAEAELGPILEPVG